MIFFFYHNKIHLLITKLLKIKVIKQDNTGNKIYIRHILLNVNSVHRSNIKYIEKYWVPGQREKKKKVKKEIMGH